ncbi:hypothetical protein EKPJFOCH_1069 [Methylobacterium thuringiense]|uniref:Uncharacterized protein n=2 Tax=Methylobacterium thuringiense TaxID=1003091 RepID=A0ABQ4TI27_9HYPH|nr:hypothetical protein EKPJFOCH_1069 [Methylobacterium thuringiense]
MMDLGTRPCLLNPIADALVDTAVWRLDLVLGDAETGAPFDLTGSDLLITFRPLWSDAVITTLSTINGDGHEALVVTDAAAGKVSLVSRPSARTYRVPCTRSGFVPAVVATQGDILRRTAGSDPEYLGFISFVLRAGTTAWDAGITPVFITSFAQPRLALARRALGLT